MGYETHFRLKEKLDDEFVTWLRDKSTIDHEMHKNIILASCLTCRENTENIDSGALMNIYKNIKFQIKLYVTYLSEDWKLSLREELEKNNNETFFCGWEYSDNKSLTWKDEDEIVDYFSKNIFLLAIAPTPGPFDPENETYHEKISQITEYIDDIDECVNNMWNHKFVDRYRDSNDADESDGESHFYPEEKEGQNEEV